jgi:hypothetical protein
MAHAGKMLLVIGVLVVAVGVALIVADRLGLGRLPGDLVIERKGFRLYAPLATSLLVSLVLTVLANWLLRR